jgi:hypothetical protein
MRFDRTPNVPYPLQRMWRSLVKEVGYAESLGYFCLESKLGALTR